MTFLVDTSVWSLALRRSKPSGFAEVQALQSALLEGEEVATTGVILLELLRGAVPASGKEAIRKAFDSLKFVEPSRADYEDAAAIANGCRAKGVQLGSVDALLIQLCVTHDLVLLTTDRDFANAARFIDFKLWQGGSLTYD